MPPWFVDGCPRCEQKAAAGLVSRDAGPPPGRLMYAKRGKAMSRLSALAALRAKREFAKLGRAGVAEAGAKA